MDRPVSSRDLRRVSRRDEQASRLNTKPSPEFTGELKANERAQAVAEESKRLVQKWTQNRDEGLDKQRKVREWSLGEPRPSTGKLNRADLDISWQAVRPCAKKCGTGSSVWETEQTEAGLRVRLAEDDPGIKGARGRH